MDSRTEFSRFFIFRRAKYLYVIEFQFHGCDFIKRPSTVHWYFGCLCVLVLSIAILTAYVSEFGVYSFLLTRSLPGIPGILGNVMQNVFAVRQNHFHGLGNYWEVMFTQSYSLAPPWEFREFGNYRNCCAKRLG